MQVGEILTPDRVVCNLDSHSKKAALERLANLLARSSPDLSESDVFSCLLERERLGSTGLGHGIALPHGRIRNGGRTLGAFVRLRSGIDYDAIDQQPVDLLFALLVPEESTEEHLQILAKLAETFSDHTLLEKLRVEPSSENIFKLLVG